MSAVETSPRFAVGCMTGTSIDALDAALIHIEGSGLALRPSFVHGVFRPLGPLAARLRALAEQAPSTAADIAQLMHDFSLAHAEAVRQLLSEAGRDIQPAFICVHGQTVFHRPPITWQLFNPWPLAHALRAPVVYDLRGSDVAAGGQGAPITPIADWVFFQHLPGERRAVVNLGGFANATLLTSDLDQLRGFDVCACNQLLDALARAVLSAPYDKDGEAALRGSAHPAAQAELESILAAQAASKRSLGTGDETPDWVRRHQSTIAPVDLAATACKAIGTVIAERTHGANLLLLAGGGAKNLALVQSITSAVYQRTGAGKLCTVQVLNPQQHGLPADFREAAAFAVLGALCADQVAITLPSVTSVPAPAPLGGCWARPHMPA